MLEVVKSMSREDSSRDRSAPRGATEGNSNRIFWAQAIASRELKRIECNLKP